MNSRQAQSFMNNSVAIRQEIQRFESVHPSIYAIYDLIELIPDTLIAQQIRDHVVCIEDSFVNSEEWTLSRTVPALRLGIVGSSCSGKSALVHRYLTGSYMQEESPEGGRFKKEILLDGQSHLLLIRDEGGPPEMQFTTWVDAVIFVFSLENEASFNAIYSYYTKMAHYRNSAEIPLILVGTQDAISESNPRVIDDARARKLAADLKRCSYYETCATYGLNVERVFQDACQKIVQQKLSQSTTCLATPSNSRPSTPLGAPPPPRLLAPAPSPPLTLVTPHSPGHSHTISHKEGAGLGRQMCQALSSSSHQLHKADLLLDNNNVTKTDNLTVSTKDLPTPSSTPTTTRKTRRRSNLFNPSKKGEEKLRNGGELGSGRVIPIKQGYLNKWNMKALNKEWKKKYVALLHNGILIYYSSLQEYMTDVNGKRIALQYVTVKVPGQKPRGSKTILQPTTANSNGLHDSVTSLSITTNLSVFPGYQSKERRVADKVLLTAFELLKEPGKLTNNDESSVNNSLFNGTSDCKAETPNIKKRHRRIKSSSVKNQECEDSDGYEFLIVSLDNKQWHFEASNSEERDEWVAAIEQEILNSLQGNESSKVKSQLQSSNEESSLLSISNRVPGNTHCADCDAPNPEWASMNFGVLVCIECCGIHRNLGSHISRVRSLHLDQWSSSHLAVMLSIGNAMGNSVWEAVVKDRAKPTPSSSREEKERWIRSKYDSKEFLAPLPTGNHQQQFFESICRSDIKSLLLLLAHKGAELVNSLSSPQDLRTPLHIACAMGNLAIAQLLIWHNANVKAVDGDGRTCLSLARAAQQSTATTELTSVQPSPLVVLLKKSGCPEHGQQPPPPRHNNIPPLDKLPASVI